MAGIEVGKIQSQYFSLLQVCHSRMSAGRCLFFMFINVRAGFRIRTKVRTRVGVKFRFRLRAGVLVTIKLVVFFLQWYFHLYIQLVQFLIDTVLYALDRAESWYFDYDIFCILES